MSVNLVSWLTAILDEDEADGSLFVRADVAAKRRIIELHPPAPADTTDRGGPRFGCTLCHWSAVYESQLGYGWCDTIRALASAYKYRPGYQAEWEEAP